MESFAIKNPLSNAKIIGKDILPEVYRRQEPNVKRGDPAFVMSRGELMEFAHCPQRWILGIESDETKSTEWGTLIDCLVLSPGRFENEFAVTPATYKSTGMRCPSCGSVTDSKKCRKCGTDRVEVVIEKPWDWNANTCKDWREERDGMRMVKSDTNAEAGAAVTRLLSDEQISGLLADCETQVMVIGEYHDEETGIMVPLKSLIDIVPSASSDNAKALADLKTCVSASPPAWTKAVSDHDYDAQSALYLDLFNAATGQERVEFLHVLQESYAPWQPGKRMLSAEFIELGRVKYLDALKRYCQCLAANSWPGYETGKMVLNGWQLTEPLAYMVGKI